jgi:uncharacterized protein
MIPTSFRPYEVLATALLKTLTPGGTDGSHDHSHLLRVWHNASAIARDEPGCDTELLAAAVILHDCVSVEKNSPERAMASRLSAGRAREIVAPLGWSAARVENLTHTIEAHSFSAGIEPRSLEAKILRDADRLDAIGAIGIARCFYTAGRMGSALYDPEDVDAERRPLDDARFALDHFSVKLFTLVGDFQTASGQAMAAERAELMRRFVDAFRRESAVTGTDQGAKSK